MQLRAIVIGAGWAGEGHVVALRAAGVEVVAICGRSAAPTHDLASRLGVPATLAWRDAIRDLHPDIVTIATPAASHVEIAIAAAAAGCHILCEKPMALDADAAATMLDAVRRTGVKHAYAPASCLSPAIEHARGMLADGLIGALTDVESTHRPINNKRQFERVKELLADAREHGTVMGDAPVPARDRGYFIRPTIVRDVDEKSRIVEEEQFGPVLPVMSFATDDEAVTRANASPFGLGGSIWSSDPKRAYQLADRVEAGMVWVNRHGGAWNHIPFLGSKQSGIGSELGGVRALEEYTQLKIVNVTR